MAQTIVTANLSDNLINNNTSSSLNDTLDVTMEETSALNNYQNENNHICNIIKIRNENPKKFIKKQVYYT